jgi:hypothetical protein
VPLHCGCHVLAVHAGRRTSCFDGSLGTIFLSRKTGAARGPTLTGGARRPLCAPDPAVQPGAAQDGRPEPLSGLGIAQDECGAFWFEWAARQRAIPRVCSIYLLLLTGSRRLARCGVAVLPRSNSLWAAGSLCRFGSKPGNIVRYVCREPEQDDLDQALSRPTVQE